MNLQVYEQSGIEWIKAGIFEKDKPHYVEYNVIPYKI